jgi:hypothetical protein
LRDGKGSAKALVLDSRFLVQIAADSAFKSARNFAAAKKLAETFEEAKTFGGDFWSKLPFVGSAGQATNDTPSVNR